MNLVEAVPAQIEQGKEPCWQPVTPVGSPVDTGDGEPHYNSAAAVLEALPEMNANGVTGAVKRDERCWFATCICGYRFDEEGTWVTHFDTAKDALQIVRDHEWKLLGGVLYCSADCDELLDREGR